MSEFIKIPASKKSIAQRKLVLGVGINDAPYMTNPTINGKRVVCPTYQKWMSMLTRCYSAKYQARQPTYIGCEVSPEWLTFSAFAVWFNENNVDGWQLDKDLKSQNNKIYGHDECLFVPQSVNKLLIGRDSCRGIYPKGVSFYKQSNKFLAEVRINGKKKRLGYCKTPELARTAYVEAKNSEILRQADLYKEYEFAQYLHLHLEQ